MSNQQENTTSSSTNTTNSTVPATLRYDPVSHFYWLELATRADEETITHLKHAGWRWSGYRQQWRSNRRNAPFTIPATLTVTGEGKVDYASERADRLSARADKHYTAYQQHHDAAHARASMIPFGQPILRGHHSQCRDERNRERIHQQYAKAFAELDTSNDLRGKAKASERHQAHKQTPEAMQRRLDRLRAEERKILRILAGLDERQRMGEVGPEYHQQLNWRLGKVREEIAELETKIKDAGGLLADQIEVHVGDVILLSGHPVRVTRVNPKSYSGVIVAPENRNLDGWKMKADRSKFTRIIRRAGEPEATEAPEERKA